MDTGPEWRLEIPAQESVGRQTASEFRVRARGRSLASRSLWASRYSCATIWPRAGCRRRTRTRWRGNAASASSLIAAAGRRGRSGGTRPPRLPGEARAAGFTARRIHAAGHVSSVLGEKDNEPLPGGARCPCWPSVLSAESAPRGFGCCLPGGAGLSTATGEPLRVVQTHPRVRLIVSSSSFDMS